MSLKKIIFSVAVLNEESRIEDLINSIKDYASEIVLLDAGCEDSTIAVARSVFPGVRIVKVGSNMFDVPGRMLALQNSFEYDISNEWLLPMNASERMTPALGGSLIKLINDAPTVFGISFYRQSYTFGVQTHNRKLFYMAQCFFGKSPIRLFMFKCWDINSSKMHSEFPLLNGYKKDVKWINPLFSECWLKHFRFGNITDFELKHMTYSSQEAFELHENGKRGGYFLLLKMLLPSLVYFPFQFLFSKRAGIVGVYHIIYKFQVWAKLAEYNFRD